MKKIFLNNWLWSLVIGLLLFSCNNGKDSGNVKNKETLVYTCPMPADSFFSEKPGKCPKCGMELVLVKDQHIHDGHLMTDTEKMFCPF